MRLHFGEIVPTGFCWGTGAGFTGPTCGWGLCPQGGPLARPASLDLLPSQAQGSQAPESTCPDVHDGWAPPLAGPSQAHWSSGNCSPARALLSRPPQGAPAPKPPSSGPNSRGALLEGKPGGARAYAAFMPRVCAPRVYCVYVPGSMRAPTCLPPGPRSRCSAKTRREEGSGCAQPVSAPKARQSQRTHACGWAPGHDCADAVPHHSRLARRPGATVSGARSHLFRIKK